MNVVAKSRTGIGSTGRADEQNVHTGPIWLYGACAGLVVAILLWTLNKGVLFTDEAYYLLQIKYPENAPKFSFFHLLLQTVLPTDLFYMRIFTFCLLTCAAAIFSFGLHKMVKDVVHTKHLLLKLFFLGLIGQFVCYIPVQIIPNPSSINAVVFFIASGLLFLSLSYRNRYPIILYAMMCGFILGFIVFINPPNSVIIPALLVFAGFYSWNDGRRLLRQRLVAICAGMLVSLCVSIYMLGGVNYIISEFLEARQYLSFDKTHGLMGIIKWNYNLILYGTNILIISALLFHMIRDGYYKKHKAVALLFFIILTVMFIYIIYINVFANGTGMFNPTMFLTVFFVSLWLALYKNLLSYKLLFLLLFLLFIPYAGSIGTDVPFAVKSTFYLTALLPAVFLIVHKSQQKLVGILFVISLLIPVLNYASYPFKAGWSKQLLIEQDNSIEGNADLDHIKLDDKRLSELKKLSNIIPDGSVVLPSSTRMWGFIYALRLKPGFTFFVFNTQGYLKYIHDNRVEFNSLYLLEDNTKPFPAEFFEGLKKEELGDFKILKLANYTIYSPLK